MQYHIRRPERNDQKGGTMEKVQELFVVVDNRPGALGELLGSLSKEKINIEAIGLFQDIAKLLVSDHERAKKILIKGKYQAETRDVLKLELDNKPGAFAFIASRLGHAGINIDYCYATVGKNQKSASVIVDVKNLDKAMEALEGAER